MQIIPLKSFQIIINLSTLTVLPSTLLVPVLNQALPPALTGAGLIGDINNNTINKQAFIFILNSSLNI